MPYIEEGARRDILNFRNARTTGELNFEITSAILDFIIRVRAPLNKNGQPSYDDYNAVIGVLECAKMELYRRLVATYEDKKMQENGDVY